MFRILKHGGKAIIATPHSFDTLFTDGETNTQEVKSQLQEILEKNPDIKPKRALNQLKHILRGTFIVKDQKPVLITNKNVLYPGQEILRIMPGLTVLNYYYNADEYLQTAQEAGFELEKNIQPCFKTEKQKIEYNQTVEPDQ